MKFCFSSVWFVVRVFSASASCALADSSAPMRSRSFASRSAVSMRARTCPACTVSPSRTVIWRTSPETLALTVACRTGCNGARDREPARQRAPLDARQVGGREFEGDRPPGPCALVLLGEAHRHAAPDGTHDQQCHDSDDQPSAREYLCHAYPQGDRRSGDPRPLTAGPGWPGRPDPTRSSLLWDPFRVVPLGCAEKPFRIRKGA